MAYAVSGDPRYLHICVHAYDFLQRTQCYATGGYGPDERLMGLDGQLGRSPGALRRSRRDPLRHLGGIQAVTLPDGVHRRGPLRRLDRDPALQRHRRRAARPNRTARPTTTATTASPAGSSSTTGTNGRVAPAPTCRRSPTTTTSSTSTTPPGLPSTSSFPRK